MSTVMALVLLLVGLHLLGLGILGICVGVSMSGFEPQYGRGFIELGISAVIAGSFLCLGAWLEARADNK